MKPPSKTKTTAPNGGGVSPVVSLLSILSVCYAVGFIGSIAVNSAIGFWYITIQKPVWNPPNWLFAPVWTVLYGLMGWAAWLIWTNPNGDLLDEDPRRLPAQRSKRTRALALFGCQLILNGLWTWTFFAWHQLLASCVEISILWLTIVLTTIHFWRIRALAGALLLPYLGWVAFATALNFAILKMNR